MKKLLSFLLVFVMVLSACPGVFADNGQAYEYILPMEFSGIRQTKYDLVITYDKDGKCGLYTLGGEKLLDGYDMIDERFNYDGITLGKRGNVTDIINMQGTVIASFDKKVIDLSDYVIVNLSDANDDGRPIHYFEGEFGVYDYRGNLLKTFNYDNFRKPKTWTDGLSFTRRLIFNENDKYGAYDDDFNVAIKPEFDRIFNFQQEWYITVAIKDGKYGLIDTDGNTVVDFIYEYIEPIRMFSGAPTGYKVKKDGLFGALSADGKHLIKDFDDKEPFEIYNDYSLISVAELVPDTNGNYQYIFGIIDFSGNMIVPIENTVIKSVSEGLIGVRKVDGKSGFYDLSGNPVTDFHYGIISPFSEGYAFAFKSGEASCEVLNPDGEVAFNVPGDNSSGFYKGMAFVGEGKFVDRQGNIIYGDENWISATAVDYPYSEDNLYIVNNPFEDTYGLIKFKRETKEPLWDYEYIDFGNVKTYTPMKNGYRFTLLDGTEIYLDNEGNVTENAVSVCGYNVFGNGEVTLLKDNNNNTLAEIDLDNCSVYDLEKYIGVSGSDESGSFFRIYSKEDGAVLLDNTGSDFQVDHLFVNDKDNFAFYNKDKRYGIADVKGNIVVEAEYDKIEIFGNDFKAYKNGVQSILSSEGKLMLTLPEYENAEKYAGNEKYTVITGAATRLLDENYKVIGNYGNKKISELCPDGAIILRDEKLGTMYVENADGEIIIPEKAHNVWYIDDGLYGVEADNIKLVNADGRVIASGYAAEPKIGDNGLIGISMEGFEGYIDKNGVARISLEEGWHVHGGFSGGLAPIVKNVIYSRYGDISYINEQGEIMLTSEDNSWCSGGAFKNGVFGVGTKLGKAGPQGGLLVRCTYDTPSDWAKETVDTAIENGLVNEEQQKRYRRNIDREDFCEIAYNLPEVKSACEQISDIEGYKFTDTDNEKISRLAALGIIKGIGDNMFSPDSYITREEAATILERIINVTKADIAMTSDYIMFKDDADISDWASNSVQVVAHLDIMHGVGDNLFAPKDSYTTEQAIATILRVFNLKK